MNVAIVYLREAGLAAARRAAPLYFGVLIVAAILFWGANAMRAADAVGSLARSTPLRLGFWAAWTAATLPAAGVLLATPTTFYLRSLPATGVPTAAAIVLGLLAVESPWIVLHARGGGPLVGIGAAGLAAALHLGLLARSPVSLALDVAALAWPAPAPLAAAVGLATAIVTGRAAFRGAPDRVARPERPLVAGPAPVALALAYLVSAWRGTPAAFLRAGLVAAAGAALTALVARNNHAGESVVFVLAVSAPILVVACGGIVEAVIAAERDAAWLVVASPAPATVRHAARAAAAGAAGMLLGAAVGAVVLLDAAPATALWGAVLAILVAGAERLAARGGERNGGLAVTFALVIAGAGATAAAFLGVAAVLVLLPAAFLSLVLA